MDAAYGGNSLLGNLVSPAARSEPAGAKNDPDRIWRQCNLELKEGEYLCRHLVRCGTTRRVHKRITFPPHRGDPAYSAFLNLARKALSCGPENEEP